MFSPLLSGRRGIPAFPSVWLLPLLVWAAGPHLAAEEFVFRSEYGHVGHGVSPSLDSWNCDPGPPAFEMGWEPRPGLLERIRAVAQGRTQLEVGYVFIRDKADGVRMTQHAVPDLLARFGLTDRFEIRLGWPGYIATHYEGPAGDQSSDDTLDPNVGFMVDLWAQEGVLPQTAVLAAVPITLEGNPFALDSLQPLTELLYSWQLADRLAVGGTTGMALFELSEDDFVQFQQTAALDWLLAHRLGTFLEWEMLVDHGSPDDGSQHMLGVGLWTLLGDRVQLAWQVGWGLNGPAPDFLTDVRLAYRF